MHGIKGARPPDTATDDRERARVDIGSALYLVFMINRRRIIASFIRRALSAAGLRP
jgi:hypothetical protein